MTLLAQVQEPVTIPPIDYAALAPLLVVLGAACAAVLVEAFLPRHQRWPVQVALSVTALGLAGLLLGLYAGDEAPHTVGRTTTGAALLGRGNRQHESVASRQHRYLPHNPLRADAARRNPATHGQAAAARHTPPRANYCTGRHRLAVQPTTAPRANDGKRRGAPHRNHLAHHSSQPSPWCV